jgi:hypothetical protein
MTKVLLWLLVLSGAAILGWGLQRRDRMIQFPFLAAVVFMGWVTPQLFGLKSYPRRPPGALERTIFMAWLCLLGRLSPLEVNLSYDIGLSADALVTSKFSRPRAKRSRRSTRA